MLVFAAFTPHTPLLLPNIGKEHREKLQGTIRAMDHLRDELYAAHPDTIVVLSTHSGRHEDAFAINLHDTYIASLREFGDMESMREFAPDMSLVDRLQRHARRLGLPITLNSFSELDHGTSVPLLLLTEEMKDVKILPIAHSELEPKDHMAFGAALKEVVMDSSRRVAIIASGDLSHCLTSEAPSGYKKEGEVFDEYFREAIESFSASKLIAMDPDTITAAEECAYRPLLMLMGALEHMNVRPETLAYEAPFGVGYLTVQFHL